MLIVNLLLDNRNIRKIRIRDKVSGMIIIDILTFDGCLMHMRVNFQKNFIHKILIEKSERI